MRHQYIKVGATIIVLVLAFTGLLWTTFRDGAEYYKLVDEVMANPSAWEGKPLQIHGYVVPKSRLRSKGEDTLDWQFKVQNNPTRSGQSGKIVEAWYTGIVPDTFGDEAEVVLSGKLGKDGIFRATNVVAKCPSKYEAARSASAGS
jgi:cytochrome c-type biogenesis protein CcmE